MTATKPTTKPALSIDLVTWADRDDGTRLVRLLVDAGKACDVYDVVCRERDEWGRNVTFFHATDADRVYAVRVSSFGTPCSCTCPGHAYRKDPKARCRHLQATDRLVKESLI